MRQVRGVQIGGLVLMGLMGSGMGGCSIFRPIETTGSISPKVVQAPTKADKECLARAMYFESNRTDEDGMLAVGTVVMNRLDNAKYPDSICGVVGQKRQFAPGALTKPVREAARVLIYRVSHALPAGHRHPARRCTSTPPG